MISNIICDLNRQLPEEATLFSQVNNKWKEIMVHTEEDPNALRAATAAGVLEMLQTNNAHLEKIQKSIEVKPHQGFEYPQLLLIH